MSTKNVPSQTQLAEIADDYLVYSKVDYIGMWQLPSRLRRELGIHEPALMKIAVLKLIEEMLKRGLEPVNFEAASHDPVPWKEKDAASIIARVSAEWDALGGDPSVNEICWFNNPALDA